ncbi:MAG: Holliday junction resolvase RuvX [bacterium]
MTSSYDRTYLGIDYGERRIGLAKSDPTGLIASALTTLEVTGDRDAVSKIGGVIEEYQPNGLVIGYPLSMSGEKSRKCEQVDRFVERLGRIFTGPIHKVDERLSSVEATRTIHAHGQKTGKDKKRIDRLAAVLILQRFLDSLPSGG